MLDTFSKIHQQNSWQSDESVSGKGSTLKQTAAIRAALPSLLQKYEIRTLLDVPCGDYNWFRTIKLPADLYYAGADIVPALIQSNREKYPGVDFRVLDITTELVPKCDLILVRDLLGHFSNWHVKMALQNLRRSGSTYLLATTFPDHENSGDIETGQWRAINLARYFGLPDPIELINENCTEGAGKFADKSLGLWRLQP